jgi:predicted Zn-dependent protease with MMP-like domain
METEEFVRVAEETLDSLPREFRERINNLLIAVEDRPPNDMVQKHRGKGLTGLILGVYQGVPATQRSTFDLMHPPDRIVLYRKNIEAVCANDAEIRHQIRQTVFHELGHYFGMNEEQLKDV